jgi:hypothetical protein
MYHQQMYSDVTVMCHSHCVTVTDAASMVTVTTTSVAVLSAVCSGQQVGSSDVATRYAGAGYSTASASMTAMQ